MSKADTSTTAPTLDELQRQAAAADAQRARIAAELAQAEQEAEARAMAAMQQRDAEVKALTTTFLDAYDEQAAELAAEEKRLRQAFVDELLAAPWAQAWVAYRSARYRRMNLSTDAANAAGRVGSDRHVHELAHRDPRLLEDVLAILDDEANARAADEQQERWTALGW